MKDLLSAIGLMLALEGALYAALPVSMKKMLREVVTQSDSVIRWIGFTALVTGVVLVWLVRG